MISLSQLNQAPAAAVVAMLGGIYEHSPWVVERSLQAAPFNTLADFQQALRATLAGASVDEQLALIRAHPDLAGKAALRGELTAESNHEQASAGLAHCSPAELALFQQLNAAYQAKFGFPFIMAVKNATRAQILDSFQSRLAQSREEEFATALEQIHRIAALRLQALLTDSL